MDWLTTFPLPMPNGSNARRTGGGRLGQTRNY